MNRILAIASLAAAVCLTVPFSCTSWVEVVEETSSRPLRAGEMCLRIEQEDNGSEDSRSTLQDGSAVVWEVGDELAVWDGTALCKFTAQSSGNEILFYGSAAEVDTYWAVYPWRDDLGVDATDAKNPVFTTCVPLSQALRPSSFARGAAVSIGKGNKDCIRMKNVCGFLKFTFPNAAITALEPGSLDSIVLTSKAGMKLGGAISVSLEDSIPTVKSIPESKPTTGAGDNVLALSFESRPQASTTYYIAALPADLGTENGGISLDFSRTCDIATAQLSGGASQADNVIKRSAVLNLGKLWIKWVAADEDEFDTSTDPKGTVSYYRLGKLSHPYILASDEDFRKLRELLSNGTYPILTAKHKHTIDQADSYVGKHVPNIDELVVGEDGSYQNVFNEKLARATIGHLVCCAYAYRTTGEKKYLDDCKTVIAQRVNDEFWWKNTVAYLSPAEITMGMAIAYDWLYYDLTLAERQAIRTAIMNKPFIYGTARNEAKAEGQLTGEKNNRGQVANAGILATALAVYDKDKAFSKKWVEKTISGVSGVVDYVYGTSGSTQEGYGYWSYGATYQAWYNEMMMTAFGTDCGLGAQPGFVRTPDYYLFLSDHISPFAFSDGGRSAISSTPAMWWMAATRQNNSLLLTEKYLFEKGTTGSHRVMPIVPIVLAKNNPVDMSGLSRPSSDVWSDNDDAVSPVVLVRTGWTNTDSDKYLGLKGGYAAVSHGHMDAGTFEYHAYGKRWSVDNNVGGYAHYTNAGLSSSAQTCSDKGKYVTWLALVRNSLGHSTISFANYDESAGGIEKTHNTDHIVSSGAKAPIMETYSTDAEKGGKINMLPPLKGQVASATRKAVIVNNDYLLVEDRITALASQDAEMIWRMVTPANAKLEGDSIRLSIGDKVVILRPEVSGGIKPTLRIWGPFDSAHPGKTGEWGWTSDDYKVTEDHIKCNIVGFTLTIPAGQSAVVATTIKAAPDDYNKPDYTLNLDFSKSNAAFTTSLPTSKTSAANTYVTKTGGYELTIQAVEKGGSTRGAGYYINNGMLKLYPDTPYSSTLKASEVDGISLPVIPGKRLVKVTLTVGPSDCFPAGVVSSDGTEYCENSNPAVVKSNGNWYANGDAVFYIANSSTGDVYRIVGEHKSSYFYIKTLKLEYRTE